MQACVLSWDALVHLFSQAMLLSMFYACRWVVTFGGPAICFALRFISDCCVLGWRAGRRVQQSSKSGMRSSDC